VVAASSGDFLADRRFSYAEASFKDGDYAAAADLARQALELAPTFAAAHAVLGRALVALGEREPAIAALQAALGGQAADALGVKIDLARLGAAAPDEAVSRDYVRALFDEYAGRFDRHLVRNLNYRGPELLAGAIRSACLARGRKFQFAGVLDLGCGTGLAAKALAGAFTAIEGVDLSPRMLAKARKTRIYAQLHEGDLVAFLETRDEAAADLIVAADVFVYLAALDRVFRAAHRALKRDGLFAFSVQAGEGAFTLGEDARYAHGEAYLRSLAAETGFAVALFRRASTREERGEDVPGFVVVLTR
jgi:predicted TPR repeat methyltransferase